MLVPLEMWHQQLSNHACHLYANNKLGASNIVFPQIFQPKQLILGDVKLYHMFLCLKQMVFLYMILSLGNP